MIKRNLDGMYIMIQRDGRNTPVCLSDMTSDELEDFLETKDKTWLKSAVIHLAITLRRIGDELDLEMVRKE